MADMDEIINNLPVMKGYKSTARKRFDLMNALRDTWNKYPELRLGQLISCVIKDKDLFNLHDEQFLSMLETFDNEHTTTTR